MKLNLVSVSVTCMLTFLLIACNNSKKVAITPKDPIEGAWVVNTITIEGLGGKVNATVFDEADYNCFVESVWKFNTSNNTGEFRLISNSSGCGPVIRKINWKIIASPEHIHKIEFTKANDSSLHTLDIVNMNSKTMQLKYEIPNITFLGKPMAIIYSFIKA